MGNIQKKIAKMHANPRDWRIEDLQAVADSIGLEWMSRGGSHVVFRSPCGDHVTVPAKRPIKPIYIGKFLNLVDSIVEQNDKD